MRTLLLVIMITFFTGCMLTSGTTEYSLEPIEMNSGKIICCKAHVYNSKDYDKLKFKFETKADGSVIISLDESGVSASNPNAVQAENNKALLQAVTSLIPKVGN